MRVSSYLSFGFGFLALCIVYIAAQNYLRREKKRKPNSPQKFDQSENGGKLFNSLSIHYPLAIFDPVKSNNWRTPGTYSEHLAQVSTAEKHYVDLARAQDQEDVWLYENWFYGMESGIIMESGALDGILFSTSFMYETFANWTAIHVGTKQNTIITIVFL